MNEILIYKKDILQSVYFITAITKKQNSHSMSGSLSSKGDLIGGIFDRWINTIPENIVFNKIIFPMLKSKKKVEFVSDNYIYDPKEVGIAPDLIGIKIKKKIIPFVVFNERWQPVKDMPQIEVKTFKKQQKMISLRNQSYDNMYLIITETDFRIDYLLPLLDKKNFSRKIYRKTKMKDDIFIKSNYNNKLGHIDPIKTKDTCLGSLKLLKITTAKKFMESCTFCEANVSIQRLDSIEKQLKKPRGTLLSDAMTLYFSINDFCLYSPTLKWYDNVSEENIPYTIKKINIKTYFRTLDIFIKNIESIIVLKKSNTSLYIYTSTEAIINEYRLEADSFYKLNYITLDRSSNNGEEYFLQKSLLPFIKDDTNILVESFNKIIK